MISITIAGCAYRQDQPTQKPSSSPDSNPGLIADFSMGTRQSTQLQLMAFGYVPSPRGGAVNYALVLNNTGNTEISNVLIMLDEFYNTTSQMPYSAEYRYDQPIRGYGNATYNWQGGPHSPNETKIILHLCLYWGEHDEFYNTYSLPVDLPPG
ncbi:MAG: hypothetical protein WBZ29_17380 [Methanocella sp.]